MKPKLRGLESAWLFSTHNQPKRLCLYKKYMYKNSICYAGVLDGLAVSLLRSVSGKEAVKAFIKAGGTMRHGKGDHMNIKMPNGQLITIPVSCDLKIGLLKSAIRKAGLDDEEFMMLLKE